jgi:hypothetical protein
VLLYLSVLGPSKRIQARCKNIMKMIVKFIKKGIYYNEIKVRINGGKGGNGSEDSRWQSLS